MSLYRKLGLGDPKMASIIFQLANSLLKHPYGIVENMPIKAREFIYPANFVILNIEEAYQMPIIMERPFLPTSRALLDFDTNEIILRVDNKQQSFTMENPIKHPPTLRITNEWITGRATKVGQRTRNYLQGQQ